MKTAYRKILDKSFTYVAYASLAVIALAILTFLAPIVYRGVGAVSSRISEGPRQNPTRSA